MTRRVVVRQKIWAFITLGKMSAPSIELMISLGEETKTVGGDSFGASKYQLLPARLKPNGTYFKV